MFITRYTRILCIYYVLAIANTVFDLFDLMMKFILPYPETHEYDTSLINRAHLVKAHLLTYQNCREFQVANHWISRGNILLKTFYLSLCIVYGAHFLLYQRTLRIQLIFFPTLLIPSVYSGHFTVSPLQESRYSFFPNSSVLSWFSSFFGCSWSCILLRSRRLSSVYIRKRGSRTGPCWVQLLMGKRHNEILEGNNQICFHHWHDKTEYH